jgi:hypothetical protein
VSENYLRVSYRDEVERAKDVLFMAEQLLPEPPPVFPEPLCAYCGDPFAGAYLHRQGKDWHAGCWLRHANPEEYREPDIPVPAPPAPMTERDERLYWIRMRLKMGDAVWPEDGRWLLEELARLERLTDADDD